jgi:uncharacterized Zn-binding protein involved in type VI secretion
MQTPAIVPIPHVGGPIMQPIPGKPVLIGGMPAAGGSSMCMCVGPPDMILPEIPARTVRVSGIALARMGDSTVHGGTIVIGCPTVMVQAGAISPSAIAGMAADAAAAGAEVAAEATAVMDEIQDANDRINELLEADDLSEAQQQELADLNEQYDQSIEDTGVNDDDFEDWTEES